MHKYTMIGVSVVGVLFFILFYKMFLILIGGVMGWYAHQYSSMLKENFKGRLVIWGKVKKLFKKNHSEGEK